MARKIAVTTVISGKDVLAGYLYPSPRSGVFTYDSGYLAGSRSFALAPSLPLVAGPLAFDGLGGFSDNAPDRWGRKILQRATGRTSLSEFDYLLGVNDASRQGATRFWVDSVAVTSDGNGVPAEINLPQLMATADAVEKNLTDIPDVQARRLFRATGSLGGARPKANVAINRELWLAKFPKPVGDEWDMMGWEKLTRDLQEKAGITVPAGRTLTIHDTEGTPRRVYLQRRFDRTAQGGRIPYISAMTALEARDGDGGDWVDLFEFTRENGGDTSELWRRLVFGYLVGNTDDHLRNHGFLYRSGAWQVAPSFDVNPTPDDEVHQLSLWGKSGYDLSDILSRDALSLCSMTLQTAQEWIASLAPIFESVPNLARQAQLDSYSIEVMMPRFEQAQKQVREEI